MKRTKMLWGKKTKTVFSYVFIIMIIITLILSGAAGCDKNDEEYTVTVNTDKSTVKADGKDSLRLSAEIKDESGKIIEIEENDFDKVEFYEIIDERPVLIVYPDQYRTKTSGRHQIYAKYKGSESRKITIKTTDVLVNEIELTAGKLSIKSDGQDKAELKSDIYSPQGELLDHMTVEFYDNENKINAEEGFKSTEKGVHYITAKYENESVSNTVAVNVYEGADDLIDSKHKLVLEADSVYLLGITDNIKLKATLTDENGIKITGRDSEFKYFERGKEIKDGKFKTDKAGIYVVYAMCGNLISNTINITVREPEFIKQVGPVDDENKQTVSSTLPVIVINTNANTINGNNKVKATMAVYDNIGKNKNGEICQENKITDTPTLITNIEIKLRGQSSMTFPKKQYGIDLKDNQWENLSYPLLGMGSENDWVLNGSYADKSLMRNYLAYTLGSQASDYAPGARFCEVYINESNDSDNPYNYMGIYLLIEKIKIDKNRVDIDKLDETVKDGDEITGGYIVSKDKLRDGEPRISTQKGDLSYVSPKYDKLNQEQINYISNYMNKFINSVFIDDFADPEKGYAQYLDLESYAEVLAINEFFKSIDGMNISLYYYKPKNEKLHAGPVWDFDLSMGNVDYRTGTDPEGWYCVSLDEVPRKIMSDVAFQIMFKNKWSELRENVFTDENINKLIDDALNTISGGPLERSLARWPGQWNGMFVWPNPQDERATSNYNDEVEIIRSFLLNRAKWIDENINKNIDLEPVWYDWINEFTGERMNPKPDENDNWSGRERRDRNND